MGFMEPQNTDLKAIICLRIGPLGLMGPLFYNIVYSLFLVGHWMSAVAVSAAEIRTQSIASMAGKKRRHCSHCGGAHYAPTCGTLAQKVLKAEVPLPKLPS